MQFVEPPASAHNLWAMLDAFGLFISTQAMTV
jgi:hypothetical protein